MMRCPECESEVAENDVFCPYCGISLNSAVEPEQDDDALESTIMMPRAEAAEMAQQAKDAAELNEQPEADAESTPVSEEPIFGGIDDVPVPAILGDFTKTSDNVAPPPTGEYTLNKTAEAVEIGQSDELVGEAVTDGPPLDEITSLESTDDAIRPDLTEGEPEHIQNAAPVEEGANIDSPLQGEIGSQDAVGHLPESADIQPGESTKETEHPPSPDNQGPSGNLFEARVDLREPAISKPLEELESIDSHSSNPMFDSVRIMENSKPQGVQDDVDTRIQPGYQPGAANEAPPAALISPVESEKEVSQPKTQTEPNIGDGDTDGRRSSKLKPLSEGAILNGRYEIVRKIGGGGMGAVYLASDNNLGGVLRAVKEMVQAHIEEEQQDKAINDFKRESMILSMLDHPAIPTIYDYFYDEKESRFYLVMKYISGGDLSTRLRSAAEGKIDEQSVTDWAIQITDVLHYLHSQPSTIVYRDLKPSNIMIDGNTGRVMLIDFGIARSISQKEEKGVTAVGTMGYAPPELFSGNVEPRSDIYSLGSTMFHLLTGADPQSNPLLIFDFQKNPRPRQINPLLSDEMERILMRSVEYNSDARFTSAAEMRRVLEEHSANLKSGKLTYGVNEAPRPVSLANQSVFCGFCGQRIVATDLFCAFCGAKQPIAQQGVHSEIYSQPALTAKLVVEGTSELSTPAFSLQKDENLLGRRDPMSNIFPEVDLSKYDPQTKISRRHARIWREGHNFMVEDLGSSNGTVLDKAVADSFRLLPHQPQVLASGDKIRVGDTTLHFVIG